MTILRSVIPWIVGWCLGSALFLLSWSRLPRPRLLRYGGVIQRRSPKLGHFVIGRTPAEAVEHLVKDPRFVPEKADV